MKREAMTDAELFAAARSERAPDGLRSALLAHDKDVRTPFGTSRVAREPAGRRQLWTAAFACAAAAAAVWALVQPSDVVVPISAERIAPETSVSTPADVGPAPGPSRTHEVLGPSEFEKQAARSRDRSVQSPTPLRETSRAERSDATSAKRSRSSEAAPKEPPTATIEPARSDPPAPEQPVALPPAPRAPTSSAPSPPSTFAEQLAAIKQARSALRAGASREALELLERHDGALRGGALEAEARLLRIEALDAAGRRSEARDLAQRFVLDYPNSSLVDRARSFAGASRTPP